MKKIVLHCLFIVSFFPVTIYAQEKVDLTVVNKLKEEEKNNSQISNIAHYLTDVSGPRLTNSPGYKKAADWAVQTLKSWGLTAGQESWGEFGKGWSTDQVYIALKAPYYQPIIAYPKAWSPGTNGLVSGNIFILNRFDSASITAAGDALKGKIVLVKQTDTILRSAFTAYATRLADSSLNTLPESYMVGRQMITFYENYLKKIYKNTQLLKAKGALALLSVNPEERDGTIVVDGTPAYDKRIEPLLPEIVVSTEDYLKLQRLYNSQPAVTLELNINANWYTDDLNGYNVIAEIPGTDPSLQSQVVMIGGHLDSWHAATGATDNAAGCAVMMEAVRLIQATGLHPKRTIRIALWGGEEQGLYGSIGYVKKHYGNPANMQLTEEQKKVSAYFNLDNGSGKIRGIYLQNNTAAKDIFSAWLQPFAADGATGITNSNTGSTDHLSFDAVGIPGFQFIQDPLEYETRTHHTNMDTYDHLNLNDLKQAATIVASFIYHAANRAEMIPRKPLPKAERFVFETDFPI